MDWENASRHLSKTDRLLICGTRTGVRRVKLPTRIFLSMSAVRDMACWSIIQATFLLRLPVKKLSVCSSQQKGRALHTI